MELSISSSSRSILREQALAAWRFKPSDTAKDQDADAAWIFEASQRDTELVIRALERELNSRPDEGILIGTLNNNIAGSSRSEVASSSTSSCDPGSPSRAAVEAKASESVEVLHSMAGQSETPGTRNRLAEALLTPCNNQRSVPVRNNFIRKSRSRSGKGAAITIMRENPTASRGIFEQMTGFHLENTSAATPSMLKAEPTRPETVPCRLNPLSKRPGYRKHNGPAKNSQNPSCGKGFLRPL